jgi:hypothetical protein
LDMSFYLSDYSELASKANVLKKLYFMVVA